MGIKLVAVHKDDMGKISAFLTDDDQVVTFAEAKQLATNGQLDSLTDIFSNGTWVIDEYGQHMAGSNLADLPEF